jgi:hypothetical protein
MVRQFRHPPDIADPILTEWRLEKIGEKTVFIIWTKCFDNFFLKLKIPNFPYLDDHVHDQSQLLHLKHLEVPKVGVNGAQKAQMTAKSFWFQRFLFFFIPHCQLINNHVFWANFSTRWFHEIINFVLFFSVTALSSPSCDQHAQLLSKTEHFGENLRPTEMTLRQGPTLSKQRIGR